MWDAYGDDAFADELRSFLTAEEIDLTFTTPLGGMTTGAALITVADSDNSIVVIPGANAHLDDASIEAVPMERGDVVIAQIETPQTTTRAAFERAKLAGAVTILNPAPAAEPIDGLLDLADFIVVNETELALLVDEEIEAETIDPTSAAVLAGRLIGREDQVVIATLGAAGAVVHSHADAFQVAAHRVRAIDTTGAGDCFVGNLGAAIASGVGVRDAVEMANRAASICVQTIGAGVSMPTREMLGHVET